MRLAGFVESGERSKQHAKQQGAKNKRCEWRSAQIARCWFSLMVARKQERVAAGRFCRIMDLYL
jgi:hypothetical protein